MKKGGNSICNIQLLRSSDNSSKSNKEPDDWIKEHCERYGLNISEYKRQNFIPLDIDLTPENFDHFISARKELIKNYLLKILK